jgi:O-antigen ligase
VSLAGFPESLDREPRRTPADAPLVRRPRGLGAALRVVPAGAVLAMLAAVPFRTFELDRFFVPKELVLHATALLAGWLCLRAARGWARTRVDLLLVGYLALSALSALFAENWWLAGRALAVSGSGVVLFWCARLLARTGWARPVLQALAVAVVVAAGTLLLQAYGVTSDYFSVNRAPGGTFGNRNFVAHLCAIGAPLVLHVALQARTRVGTGLAAAGVVAVTAALVLSRSRGAWLAVIAVAAVMLVAGWVGRRRWRDGMRGRRLRMLLLVMAGGTAAALLVPNALEWRSDSPYLDSVKDVANYREGSGAGRLVQYRTSLRLARQHPVLGVGPGNWAVAYPAVAGRRDPSLAQADRATANPWPSSDWVALASERGVVAAALLLLALAGLGVNALVRLRDARHPEEYLTALTLLAALVATVVVGLFDAVLLLAAPTLLAWTAFGALAEVSPSHAVAPWAPGRRRLLAALLLAAGSAALVRSGLQLAAMAVADDATAVRTLARAARLDPGSYRLRLRVAQLYARRGDCGRALPHARAASELLPAAREPRAVVRRCE